MQEFASSRWVRPTRSAVEISPQDPLRVLLVEDDPEYGRMVERALRRGRPPFSVHREGRLDGALRRLERERYDALVIDLQLPDAVARSTLANACTLAHGLPVIVLTGTDDDGLALEAIRRGAQDYLVKQRTQALALPGSVMRAIERHRRCASLGIATAPEAQPAPAPADELQLLDHLGRALARVRRRREPLAVMVAGYADLDFLAKSFGADGTERIVSHAASRLALCVRRGDLLARLDPRRFAVVLEGRGDAQQWEQVAHGFRDVLESLETEVQDGFEVGGLRTRIGISLHPDEGGDPETLLENATSAWDRANPHGGVAFYSAAAAAAG